MEVDYWLYTFAFTTLLLIVSTVYLVVRAFRAEGSCNCHNGCM